MNKFEVFQQNFNEAIMGINRYLNTSRDSYDWGMVPLVQWMMETDANPYSYIDEAFADCTNSAEQFVGLLHNIHHALYDDGDITFVTVNGEPRIVFADRYSDNFRDHVLSSVEKDTESRWSTTRYDVVVLDIEPCEFGPLYDEYQRTWLKRCFVHDAQHGVEWAANAYRSYKCWDESWITEVIQDS